MSTIQRAAKGLGVAQKAHIKHGIAGATFAVLDALERRGIVEESAKAGHLKLSPLGECVRTLLFGYDPESMTDDERVEFAGLYNLGRGEGPAEWEECSRHPGHGQAIRWRWQEPEEDSLAARIEAIENGDGEIIASCPLCHPPDEDGEP
jgi:hypothetical protein